MKRLLIVLASLLTLFSGAPVSAAGSANNFYFSDAKFDYTLGKDAEYYHPDCPNVPWNEEKQPFGYSGVTRLFEKMTEALA